MSHEGGYALIYRRVLEDPDFDNAAEALAFVYLILKASWRDCAVRYKGHRINLKRGQLAISLRDMAANLEWSKSRCDRFISELKKRDKIGTTVGTGVTVISVCNYGKYQIDPAKAGTAAETNAGQQRDSSGTQNKEGKELLPNGRSAGPAAPDLKKVVFDKGKALLIRSGTPAKRAGGIVGSWRNTYPDEQIAAVLDDAEDKADPASWVPAALKARAPESPLNFITSAAARYQREHLPFGLDGSLSSGSSRS
jgi:hypothetical protein